MQKQKVDNLIRKAGEKIEQADMKRDANDFYNIPIYSESNVESYFEFKKEQFDLEYDFIRNNWEVDLDYSIRTCGKFERKMRELLRGASKKLLSHFSAKQNEINYSNKQCWRQMQLYIEMLQRENKMMQQKQELLEREINEIKSHIRN
ncbi:MAG: hypothetical protein IJZ42_04305 [Lachnospiraceae bacterium]|nr:hypothetical protein [Lachnospiraceae bacterium]